MVKALFKSFFKRFIGLFISMTFVSMLSIALLTTFGSSMANATSAFDKYLEDYGYVDAQVSTGFTMRDEFKDVANIEGVETYDARLSIDSYLRKNDGRVITARVFSFKEDEEGKDTNNVLKRYIVESVPRSEEYMNISVTGKFARNNNFKLGDKIELGYFGLYAEFYINEIVESVEGIYPRVNSYIWTDNQDFGYLYASERELSKGIKKLAESVIHKIDTDIDFQHYYELVMEVAGIAFPDLREVGDNFASLFANEVVVRAKPNYDEEKLLNDVKTFIENKNITINSTSKGSMLPYRMYMNRALSQVTVASVFLPIFFYSVTMVVIGLFMNQIIKTMTSEIGILMSIGVSKKDIMSLFFLFALVMSLVSGVLGVFGGYGLNHIIISIMIRTYSIPTISYSVNPLVSLAASIGLIVFAELTTLLSCINITRITPKDATISNESKRRPVPKWLDKIIDKAPINTKLSLNSMAQNPRRFFVSMFSLFASFVLILLSSFFYVSKGELIAQTVNRRLSFDCQVYITQKANEDLIDDLKMQEFIKKDNNGKAEFEDCYYTYAKVDVEKEDIYLECIAVNTDQTLINIPSSNGYGTVKVPEDGLVLPKTEAERLKVKVGDPITINGKQIIVKEISYQYFHPICFMAKAEMDRLEITYVSTFLLNTSNEQALMTYLKENQNQCLTVFTNSLAKDLRSVFDALDIFVIIMIIFSLGMAFVILTIMSQSTLMDQKRQVSILRLVGYRVMDISHIWTLQSILQLIGATLIAVPAGCLFSIWLFGLCSSTSQTYPFIFDWRVVLFGFLFILAVVVLCHIFSMFSIWKWNLADNTRSRE